MKNGDEEEQEKKWGREERKCSVTVLSARVNVPGWGWRKFIGVMRCGKEKYQQQNYTAWLERASL